MGEHSTRDFYEKLTCAMFKLNGFHLDHFATRSVRLTACRAWLKEALQQVCSTSNAKSNPNNLARHLQNLIR